MYRIMRYSDSKLTREQEGRNVYFLLHMFTGVARCRRGK